MSNKKKTNEAEQRAQAAEAEAKAAQQRADQASQQVKITPEQQMLLSDASADYKAARSGDVRNIGKVANFLAQTARSNDTAARISPTGSASLAYNVANPNLLAMNDQKLRRQQAQDTALGVTSLAQDAENQAANQIMAVGQQDVAAKSALAGFMFQNAGLSQNTSNTAWDRYKFEKSQKSFLSQLALGAVGAAGQIGAAAIK